MNGHHKMTESSLPKTPITDESITTISTDDKRLQGVADILAEKFGQASVEMIGSDNTAPVRYDASSPRNASDAAAEQGLKLENFVHSTSTSMSIKEAVQKSGQNFNLYDDVWVQRDAARAIVREIDFQAANTKTLPLLRQRPNWRETVKPDLNRNDLMTEKGREAIKDRYISRALGETTAQDVFARVAAAGADDDAHAQRLYDYMSQHWFMPATPILSNLGTDRGLPISCFLESVDDSMNSIIDHWSEQAWMSAMGGGLGVYWSRLRPVSAEIGDVGKSSGIIPFIKVSETITLAVAQGGVRRGSGAAYLHISHPEIMEFISIRDPSGGDINRKAPFAHHGVVIDDAFMQAVARDTKYTLINPHNGTKAGEIDARATMIRIIEMRMKTGEPYILFGDTVNNARPAHHKKLGLKVETSNLCSEITLPTGIDHRGQWRSAVCCLSSLNLIHWEKYHENEQFFEDIMRFLDNVLQEFILRAPETIRQAVYSAYRERSVGLGVMGWHSFLQKKGIAWESAQSISWNKRIFRRIREQADRCSVLLAEERGPCPDAADAGIMERFSYKMAVAPTASISVIAGGASPGVDPISANIFTHKTMDGSHAAWNDDLLAMLEEAGINTPEIRSSIINAGGSIQHLDFIDEYARLVYKTAYEIDPRWSIDMMADRAGFIDQAASNNLFLPPTVDKTDLLLMHMTAWSKGVKSLYYLRSLAVSRAGNLFGANNGDVAADNTIVPGRAMINREDMYASCSACE